MRVTIPTVAVTVLGVQLSSDLSLDKHVNVVSAKCFFQLWQLRRIRRSLDDDSVATLVHAFITSRVDYCSSLLIGAPKKTTDKLQRVLNSAARIVSNTRKFDRGLISGEVSYTGWTLSTRFSSESASSVQMSAQDGSWIPVDLLPTRLRHFWSSPPAIGWPWSSQLPTCETCFVRRTFICIRRLLSATSKPFSSFY